MLLGLHQIQRFLGRSDVPRGYAPEPGITVPQPLVKIDEEPRPTEYTDISTLSPVCPGWDNSSKPIYRLRHCPLPVTGPSATTFNPLSHTSINQ